MKVVMELDTPFIKRGDWESNGFKLERDINIDSTDFILYDQMEKKIAGFTLSFEPFNAVVSLERMTLYDKSIDQISLLEFFLDYIYNVENPYFKFLGMQCYFAGSNISEFLLQCVGFFQKAQTSNFYFHLHPNFEEALHSGTSSEEVKSIFRNNYAKYVTWQTRHIARIQKSLDSEKLDLAGLEAEGRNAVIIEAKRQNIERYETILDALEHKGLCR